MTVPKSKNSFDTIEDMSSQLEAWIEENKGKFPKQTTVGRFTSEEKRKQIKFMNSVKLLLNDLKARDEILSAARMPTEDQFGESLIETHESVVKAQQKVIESIQDYGLKFINLANSMENSKNKAAVNDLAARCSLWGTSAQSQMPKIHMLFDQAAKDHLEALKVPPTAASFKDAFKNFKPSMIDLSTAHEFKKGGINTVYKQMDPVTGKNHIIKMGSMHVFSEFDSEKNRLAASIFEDRLEHEDALETDVGIDLRFVDTVNRDVAVSRLDQMLKLGIAVKTEMALTTDGRPISVMDMAKGGTMPAYTYTMNEHTQNPNEISLLDQDFVKQLYALQTLDVIVGHVDRHMGNYMLDKASDGKIAITAIDNDTSFGLQEAAPEWNIISAMRPGVESGFSYVPKDIYENVTKLDKKQLETGLGGLLSRDQIDAAAERLEALQTHFQNLKSWDKVVDGDFTKAQLDKIYQDRDLGHESEMRSKNAGSYHTYIKTLGNEAHRAQMAAEQREADRVAAEQLKAKTWTTATHSAQRETSNEVAGNHRVRVPQEEFLSSQKQASKKVMEIGVRQRSQTVFSKLEPEKEPEKEPER
ncbi:MAG: hypothetical protein RSC13_01960 [Clostridium sp.]